MDLILWRHADAEDGPPDLSRKLTSKGVRQADHVAAWLLQRLPSKFAVIASPAERARQTARALDVPVRTDERLAPGAAAAEVLQVADWPDRKGAVVIVGHQPDLGRTAAHLIGAKNAELAIRKGGLWWLTNRVRDGNAAVVVRAVVAPDLL